jgi:drug/metabolite transporter (DMT)-like permease
LAIRSVFVVQIEPVFVFLWSVLLLKERIRKNKVFLICTLIWGAFLITTGGNIKLFHSFLLGDLLVITALVLLSHSYIVSARIMKHANPMKLHMGFLIFSVPVFALLSVSLLPLESFFVGWYYFSLIVIAAIFFNVIGFPLWLISLKHVKPWVLASALLVQTIAGAILAFFWLGQTLSFIQIVGGVIILISVYLISLK